MTIDFEVVLFALCMWASVATGLAVFFYKKSNRLDFMLGITMLGLRRVAKGEATIGLDAEGNMRFEGVK